LAEMEKEAADRFENILEQANLPALSSAEQDMIFSSYHLIDDRKSPLSPIYTGYPSVENDSRKAFIALPGLTLATGRENVAESALNFWMTKASESGWVMPAKIENDGHPVFEGADNGLWFVYAADKYISHVGESRDTTEVCKALLSVVDRYLEGVSELDIAYDENGLLSLSKEEPARHWMYERVAGETVVSRTGYLVEVNALWYNALKVAEKNASPDAAQKYASAASLCQKSFREVFWSAEINGLYDFVNDKQGKKCATIRPNQILAVSMPNSPLTEEMAAKVLALCWNELYTTYGLRTLDPHDEKFKGRAEGRIDQKAKARMRGMAWPWLLGQFITAFLKLNPTRKDIAWAFIRPFNSHLRHSCLGGIAEVFDGMMPYRP
ncbi:MAG: amylo-alpha-1,6-glucosidase, partial [Synergistaceae bacterium]